MGPNTGPLHGITCMTRISSRFLNHKNIYYIIKRTILNYWCSYLAMNEVDMNMRHGCSVHPPASNGRLSLVKLPLPTLTFDNQLPFQMEKDCWFDFVWLVDNTSSNTPITVLRLVVRPVRFFSRSVLLCNRCFGKRFIIFLTGKNHDFLTVGFGKDALSACN